MTTSAGKVVTLTTGCRIAWRNPAGIGGVRVTGRVNAMTAFCGGMGLSATRIDLDPNRQLARIRKKYREFGGFGVAFNLQSDGMSGDGGPVILTGECVQRALYDGTMTIPEPGRIVRALARIGLVRIVKRNNTRWPFHVSPWWIWKAHLLNPRWSRNHTSAIGGWFVVFRNKPGVIKWEPGRWLPSRWGIRILGFEFGDRG